MIFIRNMWRYMVAALLAVLLAGIVSSCGSVHHTAVAVADKDSKSTGSKAPKRYTTQTVRHIHSQKNQNLHPVTAELLREVDSWIGTPYAWGGNDRNGVDCSGFVLQVYLKSLEISLPRTSEKQMEYCRPIGKDELIPGDLVFFTVRGGERVGHVGIYIGDGNMVHASSSKGVVITPLSNPYFTANYYSSGRVERYMALLTPSTEPTLMAERIEPKGVEKKPEAPRKQVTSARKEAAKSAATFATPMPSQVFASRTAKQSAPAADTRKAGDTEDTDSEFFD